MASITRRQPVWNLHGGFGILDTNRPDATYQDFRGYKLDSEMLRALQDG